MSFSSYSSELRTEARLRRIVAGTGVLFMMLGAVALWSLPIELPFRLLLVDAWLVAGAWQHYRADAARASCKAILVDTDGTLRLRAPDGRTLPATLCPGCVVLATVAWLRIEAPDGTRFGELLRGHCREGEDWRRFQVIWRHLGRAA